MSNFYGFHAVEVALLHRQDIDWFWEQPPERQARLMAHYQMRLSGEPFQSRWRKVL